jgi:hypothetical protein
MVSPTGSTSSNTPSAFEALPDAVKKSRLFSLASNAHSFFYPPENCNSALNPSDLDANPANFTSETVDPLRAPVQAIFQKALSSIPFFPEDTSFSQGPAINQHSDISVILALTALQHLAANYFSAQKGLLTCPTLSKHISIGSLAGTFTSWVFNQNPYIGMAIGICSSLPIGVGLDYLQDKIGDPTVKVIEKAAGKIYFGGRILTEGTIAAIVTPLVLHGLPNVSDDPNIDFSARLSLASLCALGVLSHLEAAYPSTREAPARKPDTTSKSPVISVPKHAIQALAISCIVTHFFAWTAMETL